MILLAIAPSVAAIFYAIFGICVLVLAILGIVNAANGKMKELPVIGKFHLLK